ncbi:MAG: hypothetical protein NTZ68_01995 [Candidatus Dependentiae bacterium]|nr:hypothetical protein [Candidatus Dependentiae bacterium]
MKLKIIFCFFISVPVAASQSSLSIYKIDPSHVKIKTVLIAFGHVRIEKPMLPMLTRAEEVCLEENRWKMRPENMQSVVRTSAQSADCARAETLRLFAERKEIAKIEDLLRKDVYEILHKRYLEKLTQILDGRASVSSVATQTAVSDVSDKKTESDTV